MEKQNPFRTTEETQRNDFYFLELPTTVSHGFKVVQDFVHPQYDPLLLGNDPIFQGSEGEGLQARLNVVQDFAHVVQ